MPGINGFYYSKDARLACCHVRKVEPLNRALAGAAAWVTGLRADQSQQRSAVDFASWDAERGLIKLAPLFDCTPGNRSLPPARISASRSTHSTPRAILSIGCEPCTRALQPGEPERAGRWWWETDNARECGLHVDADGKLVRSAAA